MAAPPNDRPRRCATEMMLTALTSGLASVREPRLVRERFEETLRAFLGATSVTLCEEGEVHERPHVVSCELPALPIDGRPCLVAVFDSKRPVDDRSRQMLASASQVAGLLLELERASGRWPLRVDAWPPRRRRAAHRLERANPCRYANASSGWRARILQS